ncbi:dedicator of cytokinesis protein Ziz isoform X2 [Haemaphysalis longicornis]
MRLDAAEDGVEEGSVVVVTAPSPPSSSVVLLKYSCLWDYKQSGRRSLSWHAGDTSHGAGRKTLPFLKTVRHQLVEPLDYEQFVYKNKTILQNDPQREMLFFPPDDISQAIIPRAIRTTVPTIPANVRLECLPLFVRQCIKTYTADWHTVVYKFSVYSGSYKELLSRIPRPTDLQDQVYEVDTETEVKDSESNLKGDSEVIKEGYILKGPESGTDSFISLATKSFKRRYMTLTRGVDGSHSLEFYKDDKKTESKGTICMDFCGKVVRNSKRSKLSFELRMQDGHKSCVLAAESEVEMDGWMAMLVAITTNYRNAQESSRKAAAASAAVLSSPEENNVITSPSAPYGYGTLKSLEHSKNPDLVKYAKETDYSISQARKQNRQNLFSIYPDLHRSSSCVHISSYERRVEPFKEEFNTRIFVKCEEVKFNLQAPLDCQNGSLCQVEPYFTTMAVYDVRHNRKVSEDFRFDVNNSYMRNMLPKTTRRKSGSAPNGTAGTQLTDCLLPGMSELGEEWLAFPQQAIFMVQRPDPDLFLVVRVEKVLQGGIAQASEPYLRHGSDGRQGSKAQKMFRLCCQRLNHYRMPFAWAAKPLFSRHSSELDKSLEFGQIYRQDSGKLSEEDTLKFLSDLKRPEKVKHFTVIPGHIKVTLRSLRPDETVNNSLTTSLVPVVPFPMPPRPEGPTLEVQQFPTDVASDSHPFFAYLNHLYVYPKSLKYDSQKAFAKARNISCCVELRDRDDEGTKPLKCIYARPGEPLYVSQSYTAVTHHCVTPDFYEEVKVVLPVELHERHHLLFTFYHVSCDIAKGTKRKEGPVESIVGYSWLPLLNKGRLNIEEDMLPVASNLPPGYLSYKPLGLGKGFCGPDVKLVEGGRELFKVGFRLVSTVHTKDQHLHNFFVHCQKLLETKVLGPDTETSTLLKEQAISSMGTEAGREISKVVKALHAVEGSSMVHFLPTALNQLLRLLVSTGSEEVALNTVRVLIHLVTCVHEAGREDILHSYVQYMFVTEPPQGSQQTTVHEELTRALSSLLGPDNADFLVVHKFLHQSWFFFQILAKSMAQHLMNTDRIKMQRHERFSREYHNRVQTLVQCLIPHIMQKHRDQRNETRQANQGLAHFLKKCFSLMDRGFVFKLINSYLERFKSGDEMELHCYKFDFLEIICSHEHFIALNLPSLKGAYSRGHSKNSKDYEMEYRLSEEFCRSHFLVGALLLELRAALSEVQKVRQRAISVVCNLLAKHAFDDRYQGKAQQARIASLYLPLISVLLANINRFSTTAEQQQQQQQQQPPSTAASVASAATSRTSPSRKMSKADSLSHAVNHAAMADDPGTPQSVASYRNSVAVDGPASLPGSGRHNRDSNYLSIIAGQVPLPHMGVTFANGSCTSLESESSTPSSSSAKDVDMPMRNGDIGAPMQCLTRDGSLVNKGHARSQSLPFASPTGIVRYDKFEPAEIKDLLVCFLYIIKQLNEDLLIGWWQQCRDSDLLDFFHLLELCLHQFRYMGKKHILKGRNPQSSSSQAKAMTLPARTAPPSFTQRCNSTYSENAAMENGTSSSEVDGDSFYRALLEANMATEVGLIALDVLGLYCGRFKEALLFNDGDNPTMRRLFDIYLSFLEVGQSENLLRHLFAALRAFINKFPIALFQGDAFLCGKLCFELLRCCNSKLSTVRSEACALLYLLMRSNFEFTGRQALTRVHLQLIVSVSRLLGEVIGLSTARFQESLSIINNYASGDKAMQRSVFPSEVKELTKKIRTVLMATTQMREHENDPEMLVDLQHSLANSYSATPALRKTWLESMAAYHVKGGNYTEAAQCYIHVAALEAEYLRHKEVFPDGCQAFKNTSPNVVRDESHVRGAEQQQQQDDFQQTEESLVERLEQCVEALQLAERYEAMADLVRLLVPMYERRRNYAALARCYKTLHQGYTKILEVNCTGRRLLGTYYRVVFFGQAYFGEDSEKEYIYKEPKVTSLPEISERLHRMFCEKFGKESVKMIMDSNQVNPSELDPKYAYIQVTHVVPYFSEMELLQRQTEFERHHNICEFMFETPFTLDGTKARGSPDEQCKRRTILTTSYCFPYVKKRIPVKSRRTKDLNPIEVAIDEMQTRVAELDEVVRRKPPDLKKLQLKLQGSIGVQVNAGPLAYANAFLDESKSHKYPEEEVSELRETFRQFLNICQQALDLNGKLIPPEQCEYHNALKKNLVDMANQLSEIMKEKLVSDHRSSVALKRLSLEVFNFISGSSGSSNV